MAVVREEVHRRKAEAGKVKVGKRGGNEGGNMARHCCKAEQDPQALCYSSLTKWPLCSLVMVFFHRLCSGV